MAAEAWTPLRLPGASCRGRRVACGGAALLTRAAAEEVTVVARAATKHIVSVAGIDIFRYPVDRQEAIVVASERDHVHD